MKVQAIRVESATSQCSKALRQAILCGDLATGQRLPPERRLAEEFGVNRLTLRAALAQLLALGLVTVKQGSGYTVANVARVGGPDLLPDILDMAAEAEAHLALVDDLLNVRRSLASSVLGRLAERGRAEDFQRIETAIDEFENISQGSACTAEDLVKADFAIVGAMADGTQSAIMRMCLNPVVLAVSKLGTLAEAMYVDPPDNVAGHRLLLAWLRNPSLVPLSVIMEELAKRDTKTLERLAKKDSQ